MLCHRSLLRVTFQNSDDKQNKRNILIHNVIFLIVNRRGGFYIAVAISTVYQTHIHNVVHVVWVRQKRMDRRKLNIHIITSGDFSSLIPS